MSLGQEKKRNQNIKTRQKKKQYFQNAMSLFILQLLIILGPGEKKSTTRRKKNLSIVVTPRLDLIIVSNTRKKIQVINIFQEFLYQNNLENLN